MKNNKAVQIYLSSVHQKITNNFAATVHNKITMNETKNTIQSMRLGTCLSKNEEHLFLNKAEKLCEMKTDSQVT
jgi:hypothetical protein